jgi:hypothetical protein
LSSHGFGGLYVAQSASVTYVAWTELGHPGWRIAAIDQGRVSKPTVLPANAQLQGLFTGRSRQVAAVWITPASPAFFVHYAFLGVNGRLRRQGNISMMVRGVSYPEVAINDQGDLAVAWVDAPKAGGGTMLVLCDARGLCSRPRRLAVPVAQPSEVEEVAVSLADNGTAAVMAAYFDGGPYPGLSRGLWTVVGHVDRHQESSSKLASWGELPVAVGSGAAGATAMFNTSSVTLAWTFLDPATGRFIRPMPVPGTGDSSPPSIAASLNGQFLAAWYRTTRNSNPLYELDE